jgi:inorganic pyrophosphatase
MTFAREITTSLLLAALQLSTPPPHTLPAAAASKLSESLGAAETHSRHLWRDTMPFNDDGTITGYIEIPRGERRKFEFDMKKNARFIDRVMPTKLGGYPINYGFVPQTVSYDGDPFDVLVLGPPLPGGTLVRGVAVGLMHMTDEKGLDSKVVISLVGRDGKPRHQLTAADQRRVGEYFKRYKEHEPGKFSQVPGWGSADEGIQYVRVTHAFFRQCRAAAGDCRLPSSPTQ